MIERTEEERKHKHTSIRESKEMQETVDRFLCSTSHPDRCIMKSRKKLNKKT